MTEDELRTLVANHEADRVEMTISTKDTAKFCEAVCAFANDLPNHRKPGYLIIGVDDRGQIVGAKVDDKLLKNLGGLRADGNIQPLPTLAIEKVTTVDGDVAVVTVQPALLPPVRYNGRVCIRSGPRRAYATEQEERILIERRVSHAKTFDAQPCLGSSLNDLSLPLFSIEYQPQAVAPEVIEENHRPLTHQLASLGFYDLDRDCPTNAGVLLFGRDVRSRLPGAYVQFLRIGGTRFADPVLSEKEIGGDLLTLLRELDSVMSAQVTKFPVTETVLRERSVESYPKTAVRELLMNAVMHRSYESTAPLRVTWLEDRVEIQSPGGLYGEANESNFPTQTSYRNPVLAAAMKNLGYVNRYGRGVIVAREALEKNGSPAPDFQFDPNYVLATIWRRL